MELRGDICMKCNQHLKNIRLTPERKRPGKMRVIIKNNEEILKPRVTKYRGSPHITMERMEGERRNIIGFTKRQAYMFG